MKPHPVPFVLAALFIAACADPLPLEPEPDCSNPWRPDPGPFAAHTIILHEADLPYDLAAEGITGNDRVRARAAGNWSQRIITYHADDTWWMTLNPGGVEWFGHDHLVDILEASRPGCEKEHGAAVLLFRDR